MKVYDRSETYFYETEPFDYADNHRLLFSFVSSPTVPRYGSYSVSADVFGLF